MVREVGPNQLAFSTLYDGGNCPTTNVSALGADIEHDSVVWKVWGGKTQKLIPKPSICLRSAPSEAPN